MKRFYQKVSYCHEHGVYQFYLDDKPIKTPMHHILSTSFKARADAVVLEWQNQTDDIKPATMPITKYLNNVQDKIIPNRSEVIQHLSHYIASDTIFYFTDQADTTLYEQQKTYWLPIINFFEKTYQTQLQPEALKTHIHAFLTDISPEDFAALYTIISLLGSHLLALYSFMGHITFDEALIYARFEETYNAKNWGSDEEAEKNNALIDQDYAHAIAFLKCV
jgi:chaperone required for assembly of F1-ATPase